MSSPAMAAAAQAAIRQQQLQQVQNDGDDDDDDSSSDGSIFQRTKRSPPLSNQAGGIGDGSLLTFAPCVDPLASAQNNSVRSAGSSTPTPQPEGATAGSSNVPFGMRRSMSMGMSMAIRRPQVTSVCLAEMVEMMKPSATKTSAIPPACGQELFEAERDRAMFVRSFFIALLSLVALLLNMVLVGKQVEQRVAHALAVEEDPAVHRLPPHDKGIAAGLIVVTILSALCMLLIMESAVYEIRRQQVAEVKKVFAVDQTGELPPLPSLLSRRMLSEVLRRSWVEVLIHFPHAFPFLISETFSRYFSVLMLARVYTILRPVGYLHPSFSKRFDIFGSKENRDRFPTVAITWSTMMKMWFLQHTGIVFLVSFFTMLFLCSFGVFIGEADFQPQVFGAFKNCIWFIFITASTVGYGDMTPRTDLGRICAVFAGMIGVVLANMIAGILSVQFSKTASQNEIANFMEKSKRLKKLQKAATAVMSSCIVLGAWRRKTYPTLKLAIACRLSVQHLQLYRTMKEEIEEFKRQQKLLGQTFTDDGQAAAEMGKLLVATTDISQRVMALQDRSERQAREHQRVALVQLDAMQVKHETRIAAMEQRVLNSELQLSSAIEDNTQLCHQILTLLQDQYKLLSSPLSASASAASFRKQPDDAVGGGANAPQIASQMALVNVMLRKISKGQEDLLERLKTQA